MLNVDLQYIKGKKFLKSGDPNTEYTCIGIGQSSKDGVNYLVGLLYDAPNNRTEIRTVLLKDVTLIGNLT